MRDVPVSMNLLLRILGAPYIRKLNKLKKERPLEGLDTFLLGFANQGVSQRLLSEAYHYFQHVTEGVDFPVRPSDDLYEVFGIHGEDVDETVLEIARRSGVRAPTAREIKGSPPLRTVRDVVTLLDRLS